MRLGQIFVESGFITQSELSAALAYAETKEMKIGRCLVLLRMINDVQLHVALDAQVHMRKGLDEEVAVGLLRQAFKQNVPFQNILGTSLELEVTDYLERVGANSGSSRAVGAGAGRASIGIPPSMPFTKAPTLADKNRAAAALIKAGDDFFQQKLFSEAEDSYRSAIGKLRLQSEPADAELIKAMAKLVEALQAQEKKRELEEIVELIAYIGQKNLESEDIRLGKAISDVADTLGSIGLSDLALRTYILAGRMFEKRLPSTLVDSICTLRAASVISRDVPDQGPRKRLGELFQEAGLVDGEQIKQALAYAKQNDIPLGSAFEALKMISAQNVRSVVYCQMLIQQNILTEPVAIMSLRLASCQDMDLKTFLAGANIPPVKENTITDKELCDALDNLLELESKGQGKSLAAGALLLDLGRLYCKSEAIFDAEFAFRRAYSIYLKDAKNSIELVRASLGIVDALIIQNRRTEAHALLLKTMTSIPNSPSVELVQFFDRLSLMEYEQGATASAFSVARSGLAIMDQLSLADMKLRFTVLETLVKCADEMGDEQSQINYLNQLYEAAKKLPTLAPTALESIKKRLVHG